MSTAVDEASDWQPGDPLYARGSYRDYLFNFRPEPENANCLCPDAAGWPEPRGGHDLGKRDVVEELIAWHRANHDPEAVA